MFQQSLRRLRFLHKASVWASGGRAGGSRVVACMGRWRALPLLDPPRCIQRTDFRWIAFSKLCIEFLNSDRAAGSTQTNEFPVSLVRRILLNPAVA
jgi:hypothetical protein